MIVSVHGGCTLENFDELGQMLLRSRDPFDAILSIYRISGTLLSNELICSNPELVSRCKAIRQDSGYMAYKLAEMVYRNAYQ